MARRAQQQAQQDEQDANIPQSKQAFKPYEQQRANIEKAERPRKEMRIHEVKSAGKLPTSIKLSF